MHNLLKNKDFFAGLMFIIFGVIFFAGSYQYAMGTAARMGPGYFPRILGGLLIAMGLLVTAIGLKNHAKWAETEGIGWSWKPLILVTVAVTLFGITLNTLGMLIAIIILVLLSGIAAHDRNYAQLVLIAAIMCVFSAAVFIWGLNLQMKLFPWS